MPHTPCTIFRVCYGLMLHEFVHKYNILNIIEIRLLIKHISSLLPFCLLKQTTLEMYPKFSLHFDLVSKTSSYKILNS